VSNHPKYKYLEEVFPEVLTGIATLIQKAKLDKRFDSVELSPVEIDELKKAKELCELYLIEHWNSQTRKVTLKHCVLPISI
jgi:ATP sulfurylase